MVTMKKIADAAGVSRSTVSFILNDSYKPGVNIPEKTRQRVKSVAKKLGYHRNEMAVAMITGRTKVIGFCAPALKSEYISRTLEGVFQTAQKRNYHVKLFADAKSPEKTVRNIIGQRPAGIISWSPHEFLSGLRDINKNYKLPVVLAGSFKPTRWAYGVSTDNISGSMLAVKKLTELNHKNIIHVSHKLDWPFVAERWKGFKIALQNSGITPKRSHFIESGNEKELAEKISKKLKSESKPTAFCCASDMLAMQIIRILNSLGLSVPKNASVIGFADLSMAELASPALTTIAEPFEKIGQTAAKILIDKIENKKIAERNVKLDVKLINRESTKKY